MAVLNIVFYCHFCSKIAMSACNETINYGESYVR